MKLTFQIEEATGAGVWRLIVEAESAEEIEEGLALVQKLRSRLTEEEEAGQIELRFPARAEFPSPLDIRGGRDGILVL